MTKNIKNIENYTKDRVISAIDIGTNSFHLMIASVDFAGNITKLITKREVFRLATECDNNTHNKSKEITKDSMRLGAEIIASFVDLSNKYGASTIRAIATSATREATNKKEFIEFIFNKTGAKIEVISGEKEAHMIYSGIYNCAPEIFEHENNIIVLDIGGGSTEIIVGRRDKVIFASSMKLGAIRLTQKFFSELTNDEAIESARNYIKNKMSPVLNKINNISFSGIVGTAGTFETVVRASILEKAKENNQETEVADFSKTIKISTKSMINSIGMILKARVPEKISKIAGIEKKRADIILAGALILECFLKNSKLDEIVFSPYALREGIIYDTLKHNISKPSKNA